MGGRTQPLSCFWGRVAAADTRRELHHDTKTGRHIHTPLHSPTAKGLIKLPKPATEAHRTSIERTTLTRNHPLPSTPAQTQNTQTNYSLTRIPPPSLHVSMRFPFPEPPFRLREPHKAQTLPAAPSIHNTGKVAGENAPKRVRKCAQWAKFCDSSTKMTAMRKRPDLEAWNPRGLCDAGKVCNLVQVVARGRSGEPRGGEEDDHQGYWPARSSGRPGVQGYHGRLAAPGLPVAAYRPRQSTYANVRRVARFDWPAGSNCL